MKKTLILAAALVIGSTVSAQANLIKGGSFETPADYKCWSFGHWVHIGPKDGDYRKLLPKVAPFCTRKQTPDGKKGKMALTITSKKEYLQFKNNHGKNLVVSNSANQSIAIKPGKYIIRFQVKGQLDKSAVYSALRLFINFNKPGGNIDRQVKITKDWTPCQYTFTVPANATTAALRFAFYGTGTVSLDDVEIKAVK